MRRLRVCQLITELVPAGAERCVYDLAVHLDRDRFDVQVVALRGGEVGDWLGKAGIRATALGVRGKWDIAKLRGLTRLLREQRIDLLHTHLFHADLAGRSAAYFASVPRLVHTVHTAEGRFRPWQYAFARLLGGHCDRIVCVSDSVRKWHAQRSGLPRWRYAVIGNGIDAGDYARDEAARACRRAEWGFDDEDVVVAYVGRLHREKGIDILLAAMSHLSARGAPQHLVIAGDGPERGMVENFVSHGEGGRHCRWLGFQRDVRSVLSAADVFVLPSRWEGFGRAIVEAMAASLPVIGTRVAGISDIVHDGRTGLLVEGEDVVGLAEAVERLTGDADLRQRLGRAGSKHAAESFRLDDMIGAHERLYAEVAGELLAG